MRPVQTDDLLRRIEAPRTLISKLSEASCRVSQHLDVNVVLQEVIDNARYLTGARYGALVTYQPSGSNKDFIGGAEGGLVGGYVESAVNGIVQACPRVCASDTTPSRVDSSW